MRLQYNQITWYSRLLSIVFIFGCFPVLLFFIGKKYQQTVNVLNNGRTAAYQLHATGTYQKQAYAGVGAATAEFDLEGDWVNEQDGSYVFKAVDNNAFYDTYDGKIVASGSWIIRESLADTRFANLGKGKYLVKNSLNDKGVEQVLYYKILFLDADALTLRFLERDKVESFVKKSDVPTNQKVRQIR